MSQQLNSLSNTKRILFVLSLITVSSLLFFRNAQAQPPTTWTATTWTVLIDVTDKVSGTVKETPGYTYTRTPGSCADSPANAFTLYICDGDTVQWKTKTNNNNPSYLRIFLVQSNVLDDVYGNATQRFDVTNGLPTTGGQTDPTVNSSGTPYEYCVAVFDKTSNHLYIHDPKIIIGTGGLEPMFRKDISEDVERLYKLVLSMRNALQPK
jgi:hypothetical protein